MPMSSPQMTRMFGLSVFAIPLLLFLLMLVLLELPCCHVLTTRFIGPSHSRRCERETEVLVRRPAVGVQTQRESSCEHPVLTVPE